MIRYDARINAIYVLPVDPFAMTPNQSYKVSFFHHAYHACHTPPTSKSRSSELSVLACLPNDAYISYEKRQMHMKAELQAKTL